MKFTREAASDTFLNPSAAPGTENVLTGKATANQIDVAEVVHTHVANVGELGNAWKVASQNRTAISVPFDLPDAIVPRSGQRSRRDE
jgi:hypothetical protein